MRAQGWTPRLVDRTEDATPWAARLRHPYADQFGNELAWRFGDLLADLAGGARHEVDFVRRIEAVQQALAERRPDMADAWKAFVTRWSRSLAGEADVEKVAEQVRRILDVDIEGRRASPPQQPYVREVLPRAFDHRPGPVPDGWVAESVGYWAGRPAEVVYDPRRYSVSVTDEASDAGAALVAVGWQWHDSDGRRSVWIQDKLQATRSSLERLDHRAKAAVVDVTGPPASGPELAP
jgi:hypothetical protein